MQIFIYSDESGVFDYIHNDYFIFGGIILLGTDEINTWSRKYAAVEKMIRRNNHYPDDYELKATMVSNKDKNKMFRSLKHCHKFGCIIDQHKIHKKIWENKKDKQRYLDYAYKMAVKNALEQLIGEGLINKDEQNTLHFFIDEHTTATNGKYELRESMEREFKYGTYSYNWNNYFPPIFSDLDYLSVQFCDSSHSKHRLVRAADIVANKIYYLTVSDQRNKINDISNLNIIDLP